MLVRDAIGKAVLSAASSVAVSAAVKLEFFAAINASARSAVLQMHGVGGEIVDAHPGALVGVGDRAAVLQSPLSGGADGAVDTARARRRGRDDAGAILLERRRNLHHHRDVELARAIVGVGEVLGARDLAFAQGVGAGRCRCSGQRASRSRPSRVDVDERAVVVVDREPAQFRGRRGRRVGDGQAPRRGDRTCRGPRSGGRR